MLRKCAWQMFEFPYNCDEEKETNRKKSWLLLPSILFAVNLLRQFQDPRIHTHGSLKPNQKRSKLVLTHSDNDSKKFVHNLLICWFGCYAIMFRMIQTQADGNSWPPSTTWFHESCKPQQQHLLVILIENHLHGTSNFLFPIICMEQYILHIFDFAAALHSFKHVAQPWDSVCSSPPVRPVQKYTLDLPASILTSVVVFRSVQH